MPLDKQPPGLIKQETFIYKNQTLRKVKSKKRFTSTVLLNWGSAPTTGILPFSACSNQLFYTVPLSQKNSFHLSA